MSLSDPKVAVLLNKEVVQVKQWQKYLKDNWNDIFSYAEQNAKIVVIAGTHGKEDGKTYEGRKVEGIVKSHEKLVG